METDVDASLSWLEFSGSVGLFESLFNSGTTPGYWAWHVYRETYLCDIRFI